MQQADNKELHNSRNQTKHEKSNINLFTAPSLQTSLKTAE